MLLNAARAVLAHRRSPELIASTCAINVLALGSSLYSIHLLNRYVSIGLTPTLVSLTAGVLIAIAFEFLLRKQRQRVLGGVSQRWDERLSERVFGAFSRTRLGALQSIALARRREALGAPATEQQLASTNNLSAMLDLPFALMFVFVASLLYLPFGVIGLVVCSITLLMGFIAERSQRRAAEAHAKASARAQQLNQFLLAAGETVRALPLGGLLARRWSEVQSESLSTRREGMDLQSSQQTATQSVGQLLSVAVYALGAIAVVQGQLTTGALIGGSILLSRAFAVCSRAAYLADPLLRAGRAEAALVELEGAESEPSSGAHPAVLEGRIELSDLAFSYPNQPVPLFERLGLELGPGKVLAIFGPNGAGKSTLIKVTLGLLTPTRGMVRVDGIELRQVSSAWWRLRIGYCPQEPVFFDGTLRENLVLDRDIDDPSLMELIREMGLEQFLASDPAGLDRQISSHETGLAVGIRRRFALIRAVVDQPRIVFLDEPTEGLDQAGQMVVAKLLSRLTQQGCTLVVVSNEAFILRSADLLIDMGKKPVPLVGTPRPPSSPEMPALTADPSRPA